MERLTLATISVVPSGDGEEGEGRGFFNSGGYYHTHKYLVLLSQRTALFSAFATSSMCNAGFDVIDVYPISDAYPNGALDHVHYNPRVFWDLETLLEKYKTQNNEKLDDNKWKNRLKQCIN